MTKTWVKPSITRTDIEVHMDFHCSAGVGFR